MPNVRYIRLFLTVIWQDIDTFIGYDETSIVLLDIAEVDFRFSISLKLRDSFSLGGVDISI